MLTALSPHLLSTFHLPDSPLRWVATSVSPFKSLKNKVKVSWSPLTQPVGEPILKLSFQARNHPS